jgi:putative ATP-dependent endonuclease of OLD family
MKANLFFARGVILVEGWAEELLLPVLAKKIGHNLTEKAVSVVNIGNTAFLRYARIFQRKDPPEMDVKVAIATDVDVKPLLAGDTKEIDDPAGGGGKVRVAYSQTEIATRVVSAISGKKTKYDGQSVKTYVSPEWTLEYCIGSSLKLRKLFYKSVLESLLEQKKDEGVSTLTVYEKAITDIDTYFNNWTDPADAIAYAIYDHIINGHTTLPVAKNKISKAIIAQVFAGNLQSDTSIADLHTETSLNYLFQAIAYATGN